jgi:hypothetical protein
MFPSTDIVTRPENPTRARREARQHERQARVPRDAVIAALQPWVLDTTFDRTNALTRALDDVLAHPPEDRWELDGLMCAATTNAASPVEPGWDSEECPIGQPPYLTPKGGGDQSMVVKREAKGRR